MKLNLRLAAAAAAILSLSQPSFAQGTACIQAADFADAATYTMPLAMDALQARCADTLPANSYILSQGDAFAAKFLPLRDAAWPGARQLLMTFIEKESSGENGAAGGTSANSIASLVAAIDGDELRPFVDGIVRESIAQEIKPATCGDAEKVLPLIAPLPAENYGALLANIIGFVGENDDDLYLCPVGE